MTHGYVAPTLQFFGPPRESDEYRHDRLTADPEDHHAYEEDVIDVSGDELSLDRDVLPVDDDELSVE